MKRWVRVIKVPECGYVVVGQGTHTLDAVVDVSKMPPEEIDDLLEQGLVAEHPELSPPGPGR